MSGGGRRRRLDRGGALRRGGRPREGGGTSPSPERPEGAAEHDPLEAYLDELLGELRGSPRTVRRMLSESEAHLRDAVAAGEAEGLDADEAARRALARFGSAREVARRSNDLAAVPVRQLLRPLGFAAGLLGGVGLLSIGLSGAVAAAMGAVLGAQFVAGDLPDVGYTASRCRDFFEYAPQARSCRQAAAIHHYGEVVSYRLAVGVLGVLVLAACWLGRRRWGVGLADASLPAGFVPAIGCALFTLAGAVVAGEGANSLSQGRQAGAGQWLSAALVASPLAAGFAVALGRALRRPRAAGATRA